MADKLLVTARSREQADAARATGAEVLAEYPDALLVRATEDQAAALSEAGLETAALPALPVHTASAVFSFEEAEAADADEPVPLDPLRTAYFLVQLVGPIKDEWLAAIVGMGGRLHGALPGFRALAGMLPSVAEEVRGLSYVEGVTPYRVAMKISPHLRPDVPGRELDEASLRTVLAIGVTGVPVQIQVTVFDGESSDEIAAAVGAAGGTVLAVDEHSVIAVVAPEHISDLARRQSVESILPHDFPVPTNDRAALLMGLPVDHMFQGLTLTGVGQVVGVVDTGLDSGVAATVHPDLSGRVTIVSSPNQYGTLSTDPPPFDDGAADPHAHGTHVAGSVAGNAAAAIASGSPTRPSGIAPAAHVHFTAVGQRVTWGPLAATFPAWGLYGKPNDAGTLFEVAYAAGARIHTNSWNSKNRPGAPAVEGSYDDGARLVDQYMFTRRDALVLFSAGNNGRDIDADVQIDADSIGPPGTAKSVLTVGASENDRPSGSMPTPGVNADWSAAFPLFPAFAVAGHVSDNPAGMALFSSRGPTDDGRLKPEVVAPGTNVLSIRSTARDAVYVGEPAGTQPLWGDVSPATDPLNGDYCWSGGTSMACPLVAGAAALLREHLVTRLGHHQDGVTPSGALLKAFLVNGAAAIAGQYAGEVPAGANNISGFGRVDIANSLAPGTLGPTLFSDDPTLAVSTMQTRSFTVGATDLGRPLKITLCWTDAPSPVGVGGLQNQLYLRVVPPGGGLTLDGDLTAFPTATNPTQRVVVPAPVVGDYEINVIGISVTARSAGAGAPAGVVQDFALVASNATGLLAKPVSSPRGTA